jgi:hypothetical protein
MKSETIERTKRVKLRSRKRRIGRCFLFVRLSPTDCDSAMRAFHEEKGDQESEDEAEKRLIAF